MYTLAFGDGQRVTLNTLRACCSSVCSSWDREFFPGSRASDDDSQIQESRKRAGKDCGTGKDVAGECQLSTEIFLMVTCTFCFVSQAKLLFTLCPYIGLKYALCNSY